MTKFTTTGDRSSKFGRQICRHICSIIAMSTTIRVSERSRDRLAALSRATGRPMTEVVEDAVDALERRVFFDELNAGFAALRADDDEWSAV